MKTKIFLLAGIFSCTLAYLASCDDAIDRVGMGIQPGDDKIVTFGDSLSITGATIKDPVLYAKTMNGLLGNFHDPTYGELKAGYICQFYPAQGFGPQDRIDSIGAKIDSIQLKILYTRYVGDSLAPMEVSVYPVRKSTPLTENYYTPLDPANYCDLSAPIAKKVYTARDLNISDSLNAINVASGSYNIVSVSLPIELGQSLYDEYKACLNDDSRLTFKTSEALAKFFPGLYLKTTLGSGCLLEVEKTDVFIYTSWTRQVEDTTQVDNLRTDTLIGLAVLDATKEIIQLNEYASSHDEQLWQTPSDDKMYLKTPAGIFSQVSIPMSELKQKGRKYSSVRLRIEAEAPVEWPYTWAFPGAANSALFMSQSKLLLIEPDSIRTFFEEQKSADNKTTYFTTFDPVTYTYTFSNIANLVQYAIDNNIDPLILRLVPVEVAYYTYQSSSYTTIAADYAASHYLLPSAVTLRKNNLKIHLLSADLQN